MASSWKPSIFSSRPVRRASAAPEDPGPAASPGAPAPSSAAGTGRAPAADTPGAASAPRPAGARRGPLPSLAELGAFDGVAPAQTPKRSGRLTAEDLRRLAVAPAERAKPAAGGRPEEPLARPKAGRSWHADTPFETVQTAEGVLLKKEAEARAQAQERAQAQAQAQAQATPTADPGATRKTVPAVNVAWADLNAAVQAGWIRPEAAHALWARWLARKPLTHVEDDGSPMAPLPPLAPSPMPEEALADQELPAASPDAPPIPSPPSAAAKVESMAEPTAEAPRPAAADEADKSSAQNPQPGVPESDIKPRQVVEDLSPSHPSREAASAPHQFDAPSEPEPIEAERAVPPPPPPEAPPASPELVEVEVLEPLEEANARRAAERAAQPAPIIQVTDVIESRPEKPEKPAQAAPGWMLGQYVIALLAAAVTAVSVGLGHVLFGPWGAALAAAFWTVVVWRKTSAFHASGQGLRALLGAHLVLPLLALTVWQLQEAAGWWPAARPLDMFADAPMDTLTRAAPAMRLDWRWFALAGVPLIAAVIWLMRLRRPALLGAVTALLWMVTFQAVAGVLQALGLAFHGMTVFMLMLGALTLLGGFYIDLKSRGAGLSDFARWPYLCGAVLLGAGWLSLSVVPGPLALVRYAGWLVFVAWALAVARPSLVALALAMAGFEAAFVLAKALGSDVAGAALWLGWLVLTGLALVWMLPRADRWASRWQFWMPMAWRKALTRPVA